VSAPFLRFAVHARDEDTGVGLGVFQAAYDLRNKGGFAPHEADWFAEVLGWFNDHLDAPPRLWFWSLERSRAVFWYRASAVSHVRRTWRLVVMLAHHGVASRLVKTHKPGRIVWEDDHQVAAIPWRDGRRRLGSG
jgi:hypothetical protein